MKRRLHKFEIQSAFGTLTDTGAYYIDDMPVIQTLLEIKGLENVEISFKSLADTKPFAPEWYLDFEEIHRQSVEKIKHGDPATLTMEWMDIIDEPFVVDRVEGLRVYLKK